MDPLQWQGQRSLGDRRSNQQKRRVRAALPYGCCCLQILHDALRPDQSSGHDDYLFALRFQTATQSVQRCVVAAALPVFLNIDARTQNQSIPPRLDHAVPQEVIAVIRVLEDRRGGRVTGSPQEVAIHGTQRPGKH